MRRESSILDRPAAALLVGFILGVPAPSHMGKPQGFPVDSAMRGSWCGQARINNSWIVARTLDVRLTIASDGSVSGSVGDATLRSAHLRPNRGAVGHALHIKTDWIVEGSLSGFLVAQERIERPGVKMPLNWIPVGTGHGFRGGVNSSGSPLGSEKTGVIAASRLLLTRCPTARP